jgi:hypothetical protein
MDLEKIRSVVDWEVPKKEMSTGFSLREKTPANKPA